MSIGNLRDQGNQSKNFPWQLKMLLGQQCACDQLTEILTELQGTIDVNIVGGVTLDVNLDQNNDQVQVYGSDLTAPIATDTSGHLQVDVLTMPEVEIKNDAGNPIPVSGTVAVTQSTSPWAVSLPTGTNTSYYNRIVGTGLVVPAGATSVSVQNIGSDNITITTDSSPATIIDPGVSLTFDAQEGKTLGAYTFANSSGSSLYVVTQVR